MSQVWFRQKQKTLFSIRQRRILPRVTIHLHVHPEIAAQIIPAAVLPVCAVLTNPATFL